MTYDAYWGAGFTVSCRIHLMAALKEAHDWQIKTRAAEVGAMSEEELNAYWDWRIDRVTETYRDSFSIILDYLHGGTFWRGLLGPPTSYDLHGEGKPLIANSGTTWTSGEGWAAVRGSNT